MPILTNHPFSLFFIAAVTLGYRSPTSLTLHSANSGGAGNGALSPSQGRSLREYDEKLRVLQKENFNLKLRLFFLEEKSPTGASGNAVNGAVKAPSEDELRFKQNIDLKVRYLLFFIA